MIFLFSHIESKKILETKIVGGLNGWRAKDKEQRRKTEQV